MERVRHQLACANCMLANANHPVNKDYQFFCKNSQFIFEFRTRYKKTTYVTSHIVLYLYQSLIF